MEYPILEGRALSKTYGGLRAVDGVSFGVFAGSVLGIAGPNGAGKTTLFDIISGHARPDAGDVLLDDVSISGDPVHSRCRKGLARTFQNPMVADSLSVAQNVYTAIAASPGGGDAERRRELTRLHLEQVGLTSQASASAGPLSIFDRKRLMLATALATGARVLLLDEPFAGLDHSEIDQTIDLIAAVRGRGVAIVCIEHVMRALVTISDQVLVMHHGEVVFVGSPRDMLRDEDVIELYLGHGNQRA